MEEQLRKAARREAIQALNAASDAPRPAAGTLFTDVYDEMSWVQSEQKDELFAHMARYPEHYADVTTH